MAATAIQISGRTRMRHDTLQQLDILQKMFAFVGAGEHLYIATVCTWWRAQHAQVEDTTVGEFVIFDVKACTAEIFY
jgi:hypothetical protein